MRGLHIWLAIAKAFVFTARKKTTMSKRTNELPIIDKNATRLSIIAWNANIEFRESLSERERGEVRRKLIRAAKKFEVEMEVRR